MNTNKIEALKALKKANTILTQIRLTNLTSPHFKTKQAQQLAHRALHANELVVQALLALDPNEDHHVP